MRYDVRALFFLLFAVGISAFIANNLWFELSVIVFLGFVQLQTGLHNFSKSIFLFYFVFLAIQIVVLPSLPEWAETMLSITVVQLRKMFPTAMALMLIFRTVKVSELIASMTKMHMPKSAIITLAVTIRYFPIILKDWGHIRDAMRIRLLTSSNANPIIKLLKNMECRIVPLFITSAKTADEISAAAVTRGIENPVLGTCRGYRPMGAKDYLLLLSGILLLIISVYVKLVKA